MAGIDSKHVYLTGPDQTATTGAVQVAKVGTEAPTDARTKLPTDAWGNGLGYIGEDGITVSGLIAAGDAIRDWAKRKIRTTDGKADPSVSMPSIQVDEDLVALLLNEGDYAIDKATTEHGQQIKMMWSGNPGPERSVCVSMKDGKRRVRVYLPDAQVTDLDGVSFKPDAANTYSMTLSLNADDTGHYCYFIYDDGEVAAA